MDVFLETYWMGIAGAIGVVTGVALLVQTRCCTRRLDGDLLRFEDGVGDPEPAIRADSEPASRGAHDIVRIPPLKRPAVVLQRASYSPAAAKFLQAQNENLTDYEAANLASLFEAEADGLVRELDASEVELYEKAQRLVWIGQRLHRRTYIEAGARNLGRNVAMLLPEDIATAEERECAAATRRRQDEERAAARRARAAHKES